MSKRLMLLKAANDACIYCDDRKRPVCYTLAMLQRQGVYYRGYCNRTTDDDWSEANKNPAFTAACVILEKLS